MIHSAESGRSWPESYNPQMDVRERKWSSAWSWMFGFRARELPRSHSQMVKGCQGGPVSRLIRVARMDRDVFLSAASNVGVRPEEELCSKECDQDTLPAPARQEELKWAEARPCA